jgi:hypothetical protein
MSSIFTLLRFLDLLYPLPLIPTPGQDLFYFPVLQFLKWMLTVKWGFALILTCPYAVLEIRGPSPSTAPPPCLCSLSFNSFKCVAL